MLLKIDTSWSRLGQSARPVKGVVATVLVLVPQLVFF